MMHTCKISQLDIPEEVKNDINTAIDTLLEKFHNNIHKIILFGSYAKDEYQPDSDVDIAVSLYSLPSVKERRIYSHTLNLEDFEKTDREIDLLFCTKEQLDSNTMVYKWINAQGVILYEQL